MKKYSIGILMAFLLVTAATAFAFSSAKSDDLAIPPSNAVGQFNQGAPPTIYINDLVTTFEDGGSISVFNIVQLSNGWHLLRKGTLAGNKRTEIVPIALVNGYFLFQEPKWYSVCSRSQCDGFCDPNTANNACFCTPGNANCTFGGSVGQLYEVEILH
jgi:hypothetical protein